MSEQINDGGEIIVAENNSATPTTITNQFDIVDVDAAEAFMENYQELVNRLLEESDYQLIGEKKAKKKSAWRKLATAFNISDDIIHEEEKRDETGQIVSAKYFVKATLPNGRSAVAVGECSIYDKIRYNGNKKDTTQPSNFELRGRFSNAEHDVPATAHTRAKSRAIADLIGSGENSAEEFGDNYHDEKSGKKGNGKKRRRRSQPKKEEEIIETSAAVEDETPVVEAEVVTNEESAETVTEKKPQKKKTLKQLKTEYAGINTAIDNLQSNKQKVSRENVVNELLKLYENEEITLDEYRTCKDELVN